jgi:glycosyltransferase involved in cell wall biosynthesis
MTKLDERKASVVIPAYNQPAYLRQALRSTVAQTHRPLEVIVSDDCSPVMIEPITREFKETQDHQLTFRFFRQSRNLGVMDNFRFAVEQATGKYLVPMAHDNRFIDRNFIAGAVEVMAAQRACHLCIANSVYENSDRQMLDIPDGLNAANGWTVMNGSDFIRRYRRGGLDWTQAIILDHEMARELKAYDEPFMVNASLARRLNSGEDNVCAYVFILSAVGSVAVNPKCVCEIGTPKDSYSRSDPRWLRTKQKVKFVILYNLHRADLKGPHAGVVRRMAYKQALDYLDHICDRRIASYYHYHPKIILLMMISIVRRPWTEMRYAIKRMIGRNPFTGKPFKKVRR